ncbi:DUF3866 family protein [Halalkalibacter urbisdiaboli]|uniref:DUF3866 family protein n=1 Tax=Halalkalibacter urbisdiaboli TaxID=1960589 RepID=UPI000B451E3C|nr:DUF3866 family protein [Halalkalibacter urbisdiaboli]
MYAEKQTYVREVTYEDETIQLITTDIGAKKAVLYKTLTARVEPGDPVIVNITATKLKLGTGGWDIVKSSARLEAEQTHREDGHIMKLRYTPNQHSVLAIEAQESPYHSLFKEKFSFDKEPVLLAELHSMVPLAYYVGKVLKPDFTCCVIIDDQAALPLMVSEQMRMLKDDPAFKTITIGQAFGGTFEAVTMHSALQFASQELKPDLIMISVGPGVVGTGTMYGFTGMTLASWANIVGAFKGTPVWIPRLSFSEKRERHVGLSHHTLTPLFDFTYTRCLLPFPFLEDAQKEYISRQLNAVKSNDIIHELRWSERDNASILVEKALQLSPLPIRTMGRGYADDATFFLAVAEAVRVCLEDV